VQNNTHKLPVYNIKQLPCELANLHKCEADITNKMPTLSQAKWIDW